MDSRRRGATWVLAALVAGRLLDVLDLPFERRRDGAAPQAVRSVAAGSAVDSISPPSRATRDPGPSDGSIHRADPASPHASPIAINRATATELQRLPGIGPVLAQRIVDEREANGPFRTADDLRRVKGIGSRSSARLAPHLRFD